MEFLKKLFGLKSRELIEAEYEAKKKLAAEKRQAEVKRQIELLGEKYLCHPKNFVKRKETHDKQFAKY